MNLAQEIASKLLSKYSIDTKGKTSLSIDDELYTAKRFEKFLDIDVIVDLGIPTEKIRQFKTDRARIVSAVFKQLRQGVIDKKVNSMTNLDSDILSLDFNYKSHSLIVDVQSGMEKLFNNDKKLVSGLDVDTWKKFLPVEPELRKAIMGQTIKGVIIYDPYSAKEISETIVEGQRVHKFNAHVMPDWRKLVIDEPELPTLFLKFVNHLFPDLTSREYIFNWLHNMLVARNEPILILNSLAGTGKNTFAKLCRALVGETNHAVAPKGFLDDKFNSSMRHKRCFVFDEEKITHDNINQLKNWTNDMVTFQNKGIDVKSTETNHASLLFTNNYIYNLYLTRDERKFSVVDMTDVRITTVFTESELIELNDAIDNDNDFVGNIGHWMVKNGYDKRWGKHIAFIGEAFHKVVHYSYSAWQRAIIELIESREYDVVPIEDFKYARKELTDVSTEKVKNFLESIIDRDGDKYATTTWDNKERKRSIKVSDKYRRVEVSETNTENEMNF